MTVFGSGGAAGGSRGADEEQRITIKDNRRIDRATGQARAVAAEHASAGDPAEGGVINPSATGDNAGNDADLAAARAEAAERTADLQRLSAEYANYRKRVDRDKQAASSAGKAAVVAELLRVCDDLDRAREHGDLTGGFKTVADKFTGILERLSLSSYGAEGDEFDPTVHEAVQFATSPDVDHPTVTTVLRLGYMFDEKVLRPAVVVVTGPEPAADGGEADEAGAASAPDESGDGPVGDQ